MDCILRLAFNSFRPDMNRAYHTGLTYFLCQLFAQVYPSTFHVNATAGFTEMVGYQFRMQEEKDDEREADRDARNEEHYKKLDNMLRNYSIKQKSSVFARIKNFSKPKAEKQQEIWTGNAK